MLKLEYPEIDQTVLTVIDLQERLVPAMSEAEKTIDRCRMLTRGVAELGGRILVTEQYPKGLGHTITEMAEVLPENTPIIEKTDFSVFGEAQFNTELLKKSVHTMIICGIESHVCVLQSIFDAVLRGYQVIVAADAVSSRKNGDRELALRQAENAGAFLMSSEAVLFWLLKSAKHPSFKNISKLVK